MALKSMTGFARCDGAHGPLSWHWEVRTLNGRGLDIRLRLPPGFESIEPRVREACKRQFDRGNCTINLVVKREAGVGQLRLNEAVLRDVASIVGKAKEFVDAQPPMLDGLLDIKGVIEFSQEVDEDEIPLEERNERVLTDLDKVLEALQASRIGEGEHLEKAIAADIDQIEYQAVVIESSPARSPEAILERLQIQISRLLKNGHDFDQQRLHQEAVLLATKTDINEELVRLKAHAAAARNLLTLDEPVGRRFEFLVQEFNREANTICSKSNDTEVSEAGLALKAVIDRLREQVQNIE